MSHPTTSDSLLGNQLEHNDDVTTVFTFWIGDELFAVNIEQVLSVTQNLDGLFRAPIQSRGLLGIINYQEEPVAVYNFAKMLSIPSAHDLKLQLIETLNAREQDHVDWLDALEHSLRTDEAFTKARDPNLCEFGKWYNSFTTRDEALSEIMTHFDAPHKAIHALADELLSLKEQGKADEALEKLEIARVTTLSRLCKYFKYARNQIEESLRTVVLNLTVNNQVPQVAIQIDEIHDVINFRHDQLTPLENIGLDADVDISNLFSGYINRDDDSKGCLLLRTEQILNETKNDETRLSA
jgi:chemotaxis signal transduction protein